MIMKIGVTAGDIWNYLEQHERVARMNEMVGSLKKERDLVLMSLGWLAREGHVTMEGEGPDYIIRLAQAGGQ